MQSASTINISHSRTEARFRAASVQHIALATLLAIIAFGIGLACASYSLHVDAADSAAERHLIRFSAVESNEREQYRWSERGAAVRLFGLTRRLLIVDLRMTSPRPPNAVPAETRLALGSWRSNTFVVEGDWRRYRVLLPPRPGAPDLRLDIRTFRPAKETDKRDLGAALTHVAVYPIDGLSAPGGAVATLGGVRAVVLLLLPIATFVIMSRLAGGVLPWFAAAAVAVLVAVGAARPVDAVALLPDLWLIPVGTTVGAGIVWGMQSYLSPVLTGVREALAADTVRLACVLVVASVQGIVFLALVPPWQHYDEPAHFEYAWLLAFHPSWPTIGTVNPAIAWIGGEGRALSHFPTYHLLVSLPLRLTSGWTVIEQLYVARSVSLVMFVVTVAILGGIARTLFHEGHHMRWLMPLTAALIPPFADIMTAVNNDVGAILGFSLFLWGVVRIITLGWSAATRGMGRWRCADCRSNEERRSSGDLYCPACAGDCGWSAPPMALETPHCGAGRGRRRPSREACSHGAILPDGIATAQYPSMAQRARLFPLRLTDGRRFVLHPASLCTMSFCRAGDSRRLRRSALLAGNPVTVGAWVWTSRPATIAGPGVLYNDGTRPVAMMTPVIAADTTPRFVAWTFEAPEALSSLQVFIPAPPPDADPPVYPVCRWRCGSAGFVLRRYSADFQPFSDRRFLGGASIRQPCAQWLGGTGMAVCPSRR
jgi:hypothetical protein